MNVAYAGPGECPGVIPLFPMTGALLLPRGQMPLNIFEPRYLQMVEDAIRGHRTIGIIQPDAEKGEKKHVPTLCGDGRILMTLTGIARFAIEEELPVTTPYRQAKVTYDPYIADFTPRMGEDEVDRQGLLRALKEFAAANELKIDWKGVNSAPNEALVNALSMMCPFGTREKQALLEAVDLKTRADVLVAITEIELARGGGDPEATLQ
jgi:uncharacterized protein